MGKNVDTHMGNNVVKNASDLTLEQLDHSCIFYLFIGKIIKKKKTI